MAEPGKETAATPLPPPQETVLQAPPAVAEPGKDSAAVPPPPPQEETVPAAVVEELSFETVTPSSGTGTAALHSAQPKAESAHPPPPEETTAAAGEPEQQTTTDADGQPPAAAMPQKPAALPPPAEAAAPTPPTQKQDGGDPKLASSSVHEEKEDARRRWRRLCAAVCLLFLRPKSGGTEPPPPPGDKKQPVSGPEEEEKKKPTPGETPPAPPQKDSGGAVRVPSKPDAGKGEGEAMPAAPDGKPPEPGLEQVATLAPPPAETSSPETMAAEAEKQPAAPAEAQQPPGKQEGGGGALEKAASVQEKDVAAPAPAAAAGPPEGEENPARRRWRKLQAFVRLLFLRPKGGGTKPPAPGEVPVPPPLPVDSAAAENGDGEMKPSAQDDKQKTTTTTTTTTQHRNWKIERLEDILEEAFTKLLSTEYHKELSVARKKCLLTFSVFELAAEVKKQAMIYWWVAEFNLPHRSDHPPPPAPAPADSSSRDDDANADAEGIFFMLSDHGFLVPVKNWCTKGIHGCQVNPLVHWMLKRQARVERFAELDLDGSPKDRQLHSSILCLTAGNRGVMQKMRMNDEPQPQPQSQDKKKDESQSSQAGKKRQGKGDHVQDQQQQPASKDETQQGESRSMEAADKAPSQKDEDATQAKDDQLTKPSSGPADNLDDIPPQLFEGKRVILNVNAHVYPISTSAFLHLADCLVVLQLGRWNNLDDKTYLEVDGLNTRNVIGLLKNLRYLGLRGLSQLTELPMGIESLKKLVILDMRGCQNLVKVFNDRGKKLVQKVASFVVTQIQLKQLTHLDLTECYMLEHIGRAITTLTELQVFKGFVFATGTQGKKACKIQDLKKLKKLQKLTVSITTDANVGKGEMAELKNLTSLRKLTITWSEIPSILLEGDTEKIKNKREDLVERWTSFQLPKDLVKLDLRCYPKKVLQLESHTKLEKLYLRGGDMESFSTKESNTIKTLRLRYLQNFDMKWDQIRSQLKNIESVEIVMNKDATQEKDTSEVTRDTDGKGVKSIKSVKKVPDFEIRDFTLDQHGVWTKDQKEEDNKQKSDAPNKEAMGQNKASGPSEPSEDSITKDDDSAITSGNNKDGDK